MSHGPEHQIEHAEHAQHAAQRPFDKRVTVSIAIIAAVLAAVTMAGHRAHNETLKLQMEAASANTETANAWAFYQAKKNRSALYSAFLDFSGMMLLKEGTENVQQKAPSYWASKRSEYDAELPQVMKEARDLEQKTKELQARSEDAHHRGDRLDLGELGLQLGVVLCSLAILTRSRSFWFAGLACSLVRLLVALTGVFGLFLEHH